MHRLRLPILFLIAVTTVFFACRKDTAESKPTSDATAGRMKANGSECDKDVTMECGMLSFEDQAQFQEVYDCLEAAYDAHLDAFEAQYGYLSEDDYNDMADQLGFVDEQPLRDFEMAMGFDSWLAHYDAALDAFMDAGGDPEQFTQPNLFGDPIAGTLRNKDGAVMIGGRIFLVDPSGRAWQFCSCEVYQTYLADPSAFENVEDDECVTRPKTEYQGAGYTCRNHWKNCWWVNIDSDRKVNQNLSFYYGSPGSIGSTQAMSEMRAFKKRWGKWRLRRMWLKVQVFGVTRDTECYEKDGGFSRDKGFRWNRRIWRIQGWGENRTFIDGDIRGQFWFPGGNTNSRVLDHLYNGCN